MSEKIHSSCSWCNQKTEHIITEHNYLRRNVYQCDNCNNYTLQCRIPNCKNMTIGDPVLNIEDEETRTLIKKLSDGWDNELCSEHNGAIASFERLGMKIDRLENYKDLFETDKYNWLKISKIAGGFIGGGVIFGPLAYIAAPGIAAALGSAGVLGTASTTSTVISTLSGAALTNASLAALGGGAVAAGGFGMGGGVAILTAVGAGLGAVKGGAVSNNYFGNIKDFEIRKLKDGKGPAVIFINGFLNQKEQDFSDWQEGVSLKYQKNPWYGVVWESKALSNIGSLIAKNGGPELAKILISLVKGKGKQNASKANPLNWASFIAELINNPWHTSLVKSSMTGILLADIIARMANHDRFILMGHSLGCRVIFYLLNALGTKKEKFIEDVYLFGGAVDREDNEGWENSLNSIKGNIYNFFSENDDVLRYLYKGANALLSKPIGLGNIEYKSKNISNFDVSDVVDGHNAYKKNLEILLKKVPSGKSFISKLLRILRIN